MCQKAGCPSRCDRSAPPASGFATLRDASASPRRTPSAGSCRTLRVPDDARLATAGQCLDHLLQALLRRVVLMVAAFRAGERSFVAGGGHALCRAVLHMKKRCETCGNDYAEAFEVIMAGRTHVFDSFECAIHHLAPLCSHCGCRIIGHGEEADGNIYCCSHCQRHAGTARTSTEH